MKMLLVTCTLNKEVVSQHAFSQERVVVGRDRDCDIMLDNPGISRQHIEIVRTPEEAFVVSDLGSANGMCVNKKRETETRLKSKDVIQIGKYLLHVTIAGEPSSSEDSAPWRRDQTIRAGD